MIKISTLTTCDENTPHVEVCASPEELEAALKEHYAIIWSENDMNAPCPEDWKEARDQLIYVDRLRDRDIAHVKHHKLLLSAEKI